MNLEWKTIFKKLLCGASSAAISMRTGRNPAGRSLTAGWLFSCFRTTPNIDDMAGNPLTARGCFWRRYAGVCEKERLLRVRTRSEMRTRLPHCQPIPRCNDNNCPSVSPSASLCAGRHRPTQASLKPPCWSLHLKPS